MTSTILLHEADQPQLHARTRRSQACIYDCIHEGIELTSFSVVALFTVSQVMSRALLDVDPSREFPETAPMLRAPRTAL